LFTSVTYDKRETGIQKAFSNPSSKSLLLDSGFQEKAMVAPWWAQMKTENMVCLKKILKKIYEFEECVNGLLQLYVSDFVS
jgi:hypothetical protein